MIEEFRQVVYLPKLLDHVWIVRSEPQSGGVFQNISDLVARHSMSAPSLSAFAPVGAAVVKETKWSLLGYMSHNTLTEDLVLYVSLSGMS